MIEPWLSSCHLLRVQGRLRVSTSDAAPRMTDADPAAPEWEAKAIHGQMMWGRWPSHVEHRMLKSRVGTGLRATRRRTSTSLRRKRLNTCSMLLVGFEVFACAVRALWASVGR